ncbi:hypothetical protein [Vibrio campbellii]|uniref:hypothetical protein n=1 Tax=Vibrio campbellii TaxID=680 RepID=UPI001F3E3F45|nr:hypothetical protein [Vibrio campbellii]MCE7729354.1 hypothetical protein [Vibrio campbellii]
MFSPKSLLSDIIKTYGDPDFAWLWRVNDKEIPLRTIMDIYEMSGWKTPEDITVSSLSKIRESVKPSDLSIFLTVLYKLTINERYYDYSSNLIKICLNVDKVKIHTPEYRSEQIAERDRKKRAKRQEELDNISDFSSIEHLDNRLSAISRTLKTTKKKQDYIQDLINRSIVNNEIDMEEFMLNLREFFPKNLVRSQQDLQVQLLSNEILKSIGLNWNEMTSAWIEAEEMFFNLKNYESEKDQRLSISFLNCYLFIFLPVWYHYVEKKSVDSIPYPNKLEKFRGAFFVSRPNVISLTRKYPPTLIDFFKKIYRKKSSSNEGLYNRINLVHTFFELAAQRSELFNVPTSFINPITNLDLPNVSSRAGTNKKRLSSLVFPTIFQIAYRLCDFYFEVNKRLISGEIDCADYKLAFDSVAHKNHMYNLKSLQKHVNFPDLGSVNIKGKIVELDILSSEFAKIHRNIPVNLLNKSHVSLVFFQALIQITAALETGLRHQSIQWLSTEFDKFIDLKELDYDELYLMNVNTDKSKDDEWQADVSARVINLFRRVREQRELIEFPSFKKDIYYENNQKSKWGCFKPLLSFNRNGSPHSDSTYRQVFKVLLLYTQEILDKSGIKVSLAKVTHCAEKNTRNKNKLEIETDITPHTTRVTVVSEYLTYLPADYVGQKITGQTTPTVSYYNKLSDEDYARLRQNQISGLNKIIAGQNHTSGEITFIDTHTEKSTLVHAFSTDRKSATNDFGAISPSFSANKETGIQLVSNDVYLELKLGYGVTNICPFDFSCPKEVVRAKQEKRCFTCSFSIQTVDHLPALAAKKHQLTEELGEIERKVDELGDDISDDIFDHLESKRIIKAEDIGAIELSEFILNKIWEKMKDGKDYTFIANNPEMIKQKIALGLFPSQHDSSYYLSRIEESVKYPFSSTSNLERAMLEFRQRILANTGNIRDAIKPIESISQAKAEAYSILQSLKIDKGLTTVEIIQLASANIDDVYAPKTSLISIPTS